MSIIRCVRRAAATQRLADSDRQRLEHIYATAFADASGPGVAHGEAERAANEAFDRTLTLIAQERRRAAQMQKEAEARLLGDAARWKNNQGEADLGQFMLQRVDRLHFEAQALFQLDMAELSDLVHEFRRTWHNGSRLNRARMDNVIRELHGQATGDAAAKGMAEAAAALSRRKVEQFNGAGGNVAVRDDWAHPQVHDATSIGRAGFDEWAAVIRQETAPERMINPMTGVPFKPHEYEEAIRAAFENIVTHGFDGDQGAGVARGNALWRSRADSRFFVFKDADAWMRYHKRFGGEENPFEVLTSWLRSINHDIAAMQGLGPNPGRTIQHFAGDERAPGGLIVQAAVDAAMGRAALFPKHKGVPGADGKARPFKSLADRRQHAEDKALGVAREWAYYAGGARKPHHKGWTFVEGTVNSTIYASKLLFTPFLMGSDLANQAATRAFNSVSVRGMMRDLVDAFRLAGDRKTLAELGVEVDVGLSAMMSEARDSAVVHGHPVARWVTDRTLTFTGLKPATMGFRAMWTMGVLHDVARHQAKAFGKLPREFRDLLQRYDIDEKAWEFVQATPLYTDRGVRVIRPKDIEAVDIFSLAAGADGEIGESVRARPGLTRGQEVAMRLMTLIKDEGEYATITGSPRSARILPHKPGTISGTLVGSTAKLRTYTIQHFIRHAGRAADVFWRNGGGIRGAAGAARYYGLSLLFPSMMLVGVGTVLADLAQGREAPDVTDWRFWDRVFWRTISLGFFQDLFQGAFDPQSRLQGAASFAGPTLSLYTDMVELGGTAIGEAQAALGLREDDTRLGRTAIKTVRNNFIPRTWATDLAIDRLFWDNMQRVADPEAEADFARRAARIEQGSWWGPGETLPNRGPDLSTLDLSDADADLSGGVR